MSALHLEVLSRPSYRDRSRLGASCQKGGPRSAHRSLDGLRAAAGGRIRVLLVSRSPDAIAAHMLGHLPSTYAKPHRLLYYNDPVIPDCASGHPADSIGRPARTLDRRLEGVDQVRLSSTSLRCRAPRVAASVQSSLPHRAVSYYRLRTGRVAYRSSAIRETPRLTSHLGWQ
jgi:hypothetical protein